MDILKELPDQIKARWVTRRRLAITAFISILVTLIFYMLVGLFANEEQVENAVLFVPLVQTIVTALIAYITTWATTAFLEDRTKIKKDRSKT